MINFETIKQKLKELRELVFNNKSRLDNLKLSQIQNDDNYVQDSNYVHTDNNYTSSDKSKVDTIGTIPDTYYANGADYAEVGEWYDGNPGEEDRLYRFVTLKADGRKIAIASSTDQIAGVTNTKAAFVGNAAGYDSNDSKKNIIGIIGVVPVRTNDTSIKANDRVMSDDNGYAVKSTNNLGYRVLKVLEPGLLEIVVSVNTDMIQRIKTDMDEVEKTLTSVKSKSGAELVVTLDETNYIMKIKMLNSRKEVVSEQEVDFPIESLVIGASYKDGVLTIELQNGTTVPVDISDLISGLVNETDFNKAMEDVYKYINDLNDGIRGSIEEYNQNAIEKVDSYNTNATNSLNIYNTNASNKTNTYNLNAESKTAAYNSNTENKVKEYNQNATEKVKEYNENADELINKTSVLESEIEELESLIPKATSQGTNSLEYNNAKAFRIPMAMYKGNVEQDSLSGKNLWNGTFTSNKRITTSNGKMYDSSTHNTTGYIEIDGNENYVLKTIDNEKSYFAWYSSNNESSYISGGSWTSEDTRPAPANAKYIKFDYKQEATEVMLSKGTEPTPYEPYCGGTPAPNPSYPMEVRTLKGWNLLDEKDLSAISNATLENGVLTSVPLTSTVNYVSVQQNEIIPVNVGDSLYFSVDVRLKSGSYNTNFSGVRTSNISVGNTVLTAVNNPNLTNEFQRYVFKSEYKVTGDVNRLMIQLKTTSLNNDVIECKNLMISKENKPYLPYRSIGVKRTGENLFDITKKGGHGLLTSGQLIYLKEGESVYYQVIGTYTQSSRIFGALYENKNEDDKTKYLENTAIFSQLNEKNIYTASKNGWFGVCLVAGSQTFDITDIMVSKYDFDDVEPYTEQINYIDIQDNEILTDDEIVIENGKAKLVKNWGKVVLDGSERWREVEESGGFKRTSISLAQRGIINVGQARTLDILCDRFYKNTVNNYNIIFHYGYEVYFYLPKEMNTLNEFIDFINTTKPVLYYKLAEPQEIDLGKVNIKSLEDVNNVEILATLEPTGMKESYVVDLMKLIGDSNE